jgi:23S rRNA pseudouridine1911/1915/1917 synthase
MKESIEICFLEDFPSLQEGIFALTAITRNQLKKLMPKKQLSQFIKARRCYSVPLDVINWDKINPDYNGPAPTILFEDEKFLILEKPAKTHCYAHNYSDQNNLLSFLQTQRAELLNVNSSERDRGFFYRLDFETSGILYFAKSTHVQKFMRENFAMIMDEKKYLAIVSGAINSEGRLRNYLESTGVGGSLVRVANRGVLCECDYKRLAYNEESDVSLVEVKLKQGHRHQIRVQLQAMGFPIVGDPLYGDRDYPRMLLHCYQYIFDFEDHKYDLASVPEFLRDFFADFYRQLKML